MQFRIAEPFEVPEEDILSIRPVGWTLASIAAVEIDPPNWALSNLMKRGGRHQSKRIKETMVQGFRPSAGPLIPFVRNKEEEEAYESALAGHRKKHRGERGRRNKENASQAEEEVVVGNLPEGEYRFWKGYALSYSDPGFCLCRWCNTACHGREERNAHHSVKYCKERLLAVARFAIQKSKQRFCFACRRATSFERWGVPLCNNHECLRDWRFAFSENLSGFQLYRELAESAQDEDPNNGPFKGLPEDEDSVDDYLCGEM